MIKFYIESLASFTNKQIGSVVYLGAGSGGQVSQICELNPNSLIAVESSNQLFTSLERKLKKYEFTSLYKDWVFPGSNTEGIVNLYNNPRFNSVKTSEGLRHKNLKLVSKEKATGKSLNGVLAAANLSDEVLNFLVLDVINADLFLIELIKNIAVIKQLDFVIIPKSSVLEDTKNISFFNCDEYICLPTFDESNCYLFQKNASFLAVNVDKKDSELKDLRNELENYKADRARDAEVAQKEKAALTAEIKEVNDELERTKQAAIDKEKETSEHIANIASEHDKIKQQVDSLNANVDEKEKSLQTLTEQLEQLKNDKELQRTNLIKQLETAKGLSRQSANTTDITSKLNLKLQADLDDLRQKYAEKIKSEEKLSNLVNELYVKLKQAAEFYHALELKYPEIASEKNDS